MSRRPLSARRAALIRAGIIAAVTDSCTGQRSTLHNVHPLIIAAYGRTLARLRVDQLNSVDRYQQAHTKMVAHILDQLTANAHPDDTSQFADIMRRNGFQ